MSSDAEYFEHQHYHEWYGTICSRHCPYFKESPLTKFIVGLVTNLLCWFPVVVLVYLLYRWSN